MTELPDDHVLVTSRSEWRAWLDAHHTSASGVWVVTFKKSAPGLTLPYEDIVEEALCFGWVDSRPGKVDDQLTRLYVSPRKPGSLWARPNKLRVERLITQGLMTEAGLAKVREAQASGAWNGLDEVEDLTVPPDLEAAFLQHPGSAEQFAGFPRSARRGILEWIVQARRPETRAARIAETARLAADGVRANQWRPKA